MTNTKLYTSLDYGTLKPPAAEEKIFDLLKLVNDMRKLTCKKKFTQAQSK